MKEKNRGTGKQYREDMEDYGEGGTHKFMRKCIKTLDDPLLQIFFQRSIYHICDRFLCSHWDCLECSRRTVSATLQSFYTKKKRGSNS